MSEKKPGLLPSPFERVLPKSLRVGKDRLQMRLDFYGESIVMQDMEKKGGSFRIVAAHDIAHALASELSFTTGMLPENTLWWTNTKGGPVMALWVAPAVRTLALQIAVDRTPDRYKIPLPGLIFLCRSGQPPSVYASFERPKSPKSRIWKAPLPNIYFNGRSCPGSNRYPGNIAEIPDSFFQSFFTEAVSSSGRSKKYPCDITDMWKELHNAKKENYPLTDLVYEGILADLMRRD